MAGAAGGALVGAGVAALAKKGSPNAMVVGAAAGALVGGLAGAAYGDSVAKKKEGYVKKESALDSQLDGLKRQIAILRDHNGTLHELISGKERQLAAVLAADRSAGPTVLEFDLRTSVNTKIGEIDREARSWQETIDAHKKVLARAGGESRSDELQSGIEELSEERAQLLRQRERLSAINTKLAR
jgi:DNA-binding FrmR family transcriptional regulator